jgi:hypothetical protein
MDVVDDESETVRDEDAVGERVNGVADHSLSAG